MENQTNEIKNNSVGDSEIAKLLKKQLSQQRCMIILLIVIALVLLGSVIFMVVQLKDAKNLIADTDKTLAEVQDKIETLDIEQVNSAVSDAVKILGTLNEASDDITSVLEESNKVLSTVNNVSDTINGVADTINTVKDKVDSVTGFFGWR